MGSYIVRNEYGAFCSVCQSPLGIEEDDWDTCDACGGEGFGEDDDHLFELEDEALFGPPPEFTPTQDNPPMTRTAEDERAAIVAKGLTEAQRGMLLRARPGFREPPRHYGPAAQDLTTAAERLTMKEAA